MVDNEFLESSSFEEIQDHIDKLEDIFKRKIKEFVDLQTEILKLNHIIDIEGSPTGTDKKRGGSGEGSDEIGSNDSSDNKGSGGNSAESEGKK